jgi:hypothetical protein
MENEIDPLLDWTENTRRMAEFMAGKDHKAKAVLMSAFVRRSLLDCNTRASVLNLVQRLKDKKEDEAANWQTDWKTIKERPAEYNLTADNVKVSQPPWNDSQAQLMSRMVGLVARTPSFLQHLDEALKQDTLSAVTLVEKKTLAAVAEVEKRLMKELETTRSELTAVKADYQKLLSVVELHLKAKSLLEIPALNGPDSGFSLFRVSGLNDQCVWRILALFTPEARSLDLKTLTIQEQPARLDPLIEPLIASVVKRLSQKPTDWFLTNFGGRSENKDLKIAESENEQVKKDTVQRLTHRQGKASWQELALVCEEALNLDLLVFGTGLGVGDKPMDLRPRDSQRDLTTIFFTEDVVTNQNGVVVNNSHWDLGFEETKDGPKYRWSAADEERVRSAFASKWKAIKQRKAEKQVAADMKYAQELAAKEQSQKENADKAAKEAADRAAKEAAEKTGKEAPAKPNEVAGKKDGAAAPSRARAGKLLPALHVKPTEPNETVLTITSKLAKAGLSVQLLSSVSKLGNTANWCVSSTDVKALVKEASSVKSADLSIREWKPQPTGNSAPDSKPQAAGKRAQAEKRRKKKQDAARDKSVSKQQNPTQKQMLQQVLSNQLSQQQQIEQLKAMTGANVFGTSRSVSPAHFHYSPPQTPVNGNVPANPQQPFRSQRVPTRQNAPFLAHHQQSQQSEQQERCQLYAHFRQCPVGSSCQYAHF